MTLRQKVVGVFIVISLLVTLNSLFSFLFLKQMQGSYKSLIDRGLAVLEQVGGIREQTERQNSLLFGLLVDPSKEKEQVLATVNAKLSESIAQLEQLSETDEERSEVRKLAEANATFARLTQKITDYLNRGEPGLASRSRCRKR
ncbi:MCP four helix bundle domain-containing protein [Paenibacillus sp. EPM92]|uniref:MCP four helix bundle domain-containing protein n=1 Tax=Paenibacillus sp. EPM92 TaxID=1561195 RepID=UPI0019161081|nr:MCP four helix bundle domain-containing protein [Paenibacillus sp. EPM92]